MLETYKFLGIKDDHIFRLKDTNLDDLIVFKCKIEGIFRNAQKNKTNIFFISWYGGHGEMYDGSTSTQIYLNDPDPKRRRYSWEKELTVLSRFSYTYTLAYFDCCRVGVRYRCKSEIDEGPKTGNLKIIFACKPGKITDADSKLSQFV